MCLSYRVLSRVNPVELLVQRVIINGPDVPKAVDRKDDVRTLLFINHHAVDGALLTEEQEGGRSTAGSVVSIQGVVGRASTHKTSNGHSQAEVGAVPIAGGTLIPPCLPGRVEDQDVHHIVQMALDDGAVLATGFVGTFNAASAPVCPVDVVSRSVQ